MTLSQDFEQDAMDAFDGELHAATLTQQADTVYDADNPTRGPTSTPVPHSCQGIAFAYQHRDIDNTRIVKGDYRVVILRGSLSVTPAVGDSISIPPPGKTVAVTARVIAIEAETDAQITLQVRGV